MADRQETAGRISDTKRDAIVAKLELDIEAADNYYEKTIEPLVMERYDIYNASKRYYQKKFPKLSQRCDITSTDIQDTIESTMPSLMKTFFGSADVVTVQGMDGTDSDEDRAEKMQALINYQLDRNHFFMTFYQWAKDALITNLGIIKVDWERIEEPVQDRITVSYDAAQQTLAQAQQEGWQIDNIDEVPEIGGYVVDYTRREVKKNQPRIMNIMASEFRFSPDATKLEDADFVAHRKIVTIDYLRKQEESGLYQHIDELARKATTPEYTILEKETNEDIDEQPNQADTGRQKVALYECYVNLNMSDDPDAGLTPMIVTVSNGVILRMEENTYERNPFFVLSPRVDPHKIWPENGFVDLVAQIQHAKTAIIRQMIYSLALSNDSRMAINMSMLDDVNDVVESKQFIRVRGNIKEALMPIPASDIQSWTFSMLEYLDMTKENRTGITRYNQGMDSNSLNKMLDIETPVPMADGSFKLLKDIVDGDRIVGRDGKPVTVLKAHRIHYPERAYNITFQSGEVICAGGEHLWTVTTQHKATKVMDTDSIYEYIHGHSANLYIPKVGEVDFDGGHALPVDPYLLGVYLGDGHRHSCRITVNDAEILEYAKAWAKANGCSIEPCKTGQNAGNATTYSITGTLWETLHGLHIVKRRKEEQAEKYIPEEYFHASYADRLALLQGLMDTDGCHHSGALCIFTQKDGRLLEDVFRLVESLGWVPSKHVTNPGELAKEGVTYYNLHFSADACPFRIPRKAARWEPRKRCAAYQKIESIELAGIRLMRCLTVDAEDGLFCVGKRFTVTHNTATGINILTQQSNQRLELVARIFAETGLRDMFKFLIKLNQLFVNQETVIRLTNGTMQIAPDDLDGEFDLIINAGMGNGAKEQNLADLQMLQGLMTQLGQIGMVGPEQIYNAAKKFIETLGYKNVDDFIMSPEESQQYQQQMAQQQAAQANQPMREDLRLQWAELPWQVQMQILQKEGYQVDPSWFTEKTQEDVLRKAVEEQAKADAATERGGMNGFGAGAAAPPASGAWAASGGNPPGHGGVP